MSDELKPMKSRHRDREITDLHGIAQGRNRVLRKKLGFSARRAMLLVEGIIPTGIMARTGVSETVTPTVYTELRREETEF